MITWKRANGVLAVIAAAGMVMLTGCAASLKPFASKELKAKEGVKMAVLPFDNISKTQGAGKSMENIILIEFLKTSPIKIIDPGEVSAALSEERVRLATAIPRETLQNLGKRLGVDMFLVGVVHEYEMQLASGAGGAGQVPLIAVTLRVIDAGSGDILWASNATRTGIDKESVFGIGKIQSLNALAEATAKDLATAFADSFQK